MPGKVEMRVATAKPGVNNLLEGLTGAVGEVRIFGYRKTSKEKGENDRAHANGIDGDLLQSSPEEKHDYGAEGWEKRNQIDVVKK
jgi:hypothetical protein